MSVVPFNLTLKDPCKDAEIGIESSIIQNTIAYHVHAASQPDQRQLDKLKISISTAINCLAEH